MFLAILTLVTALSISAVAIYYSVAGLVAIFAAAAIPIIIMGGVLEIGKLVTAVWLHKYWGRATWWLRTYLSAAVIILMFITSMGIFGFLSKAHIEQTSAAGEGVAQIEQIEAEIARQQAVIARAEQIVETTQTSGTGADQNIQSQIDREQQRIDTAYDRVQPAIEATRAQLESDKQFYLDQLPGIDEKLTQFETLSRIDTNDEEQVKRLQAFVGARPDGAYGGGTARAVKAFKEGLEAERTDILAKVEELKANSAEEIARLRSRAESEIDDSNKLITRLRSQLGTSTGEDIDAIIDEQNARIKTANAELDTLTEEKFQLEAQYRALEAEVGPIKYIAEFIYGEQADKNLLEEAVRWVIIVIIVVFDPLAVLLLIASQYTFGYAREGNDAITEEKEDESDSDGGPENPDGDGPPDGTNPGSKEPVPEEQTTDSEETQESLEEWYSEEDEKRMDVIGQNGNDGLHYDEVDQFSEEDPVSKEERNEQINEIIEEIETQAKTIEEQVDTDVNEEKSDLAAWNKMIEEAERAAEEEDEDEDEFEGVSPNEKVAMQQWKADNPNSSLKIQRRLYRNGKIDELPWKQYLEPEDDYPKVDPDVLEAARWAEEQIEKQQSSYVQNSEQSESTIWQRVKQAKNDN